MLWSHTHEPDGSIDVHPPISRAAAHADSENGRVAAAIVLSRVTNYHCTEQL